MMASRHVRSDSDDTLDSRNGSDLLVRIPIAASGQQGIHLVPLSTRRVLSDSRPISPDLQRMDPARRIQDLSPSPRGTVQFSDSAFMEGFRLPGAEQFVTTRVRTEKPETTQDTKELADAKTRLALLTVEHQIMLMTSNIRNLKQSSRSSSSRSSSRRSSSHPTSAAGESASPRGSRLAEPPTSDGSSTPPGAERMLHSPRPVQRGAPTRTSADSSGSRSRERREHHRERRADREARRREDRDKRRFEEREAQRQADREERAERKAEREDRREERALSAQVAALGGRAKYSIGTALEKFRTFDGTEGTDGAAYLAAFSKQLSTLEIPKAKWAQELFLKLTGTAADWYGSRFEDLATDVFPAWGELYSSMLLQFSKQYEGAGAFQDLIGATRLSGTTGLQALQRIEALTVALHRKGIRNPGPSEQLAYVLQNQLSTEEVPRWTSLANADGTISDATLNELELNSTPTTTSRHSCLPETRETFFARRVDHLRNFLRDQSKSSTGGRPSGSAPTRPSAYARAAVATRETTAEDETVAPPPPPASGPSKTGAQTSAPSLECRLCVARAERDAGAARKRPVSYPEYVGPNQQHADANKAEFLRRQRFGLCYACPGKELNEQRCHLDCTQHGRLATDKQRADQAHRVPGAGAPI